MSEDQEANVVGRKVSVYLSADLHRELNALKGQRFLLQRYDAEGKPYKQELVFPRQDAQLLRMAAQTMLAMMNDASRLEQLKEEA